MAKDLKFRIVLQNLLKGGLDTAVRQIKGFQQAAERVAAGVRGAFSRISGAILNVKTVIAAAGIAGVMRGVGEAIKQAFRVETALTQLKVLTGDMEKAKAVFKDLKAFSDATPFEFGEVAQAGRMLLAFGTSTENLIPTLTRIGDVAAAVGMSFTELAEIYGKNKVQGRLMAQDINQLTGRGIPIIQELAKQFGVSESEVRGLVEAGQVGFQAMEQAFINLTSNGGKFYGMMQELSTTGDGLFSTLKGEWLGAMADFGQGFMDLAKNGITGAINRLKELRESGAITRWAEDAAAKIKIVKDALLSIASGDTTTLKLSFNVLKEGAKAAFMTAAGYLLKVAPLIGELIGKAAFRLLGTERGQAMADARQEMVDKGLLTKRGMFGGVGSEAERQGLTKENLRQMLEDRTNEILRERGAAEADVASAALNLASGFGDAVDQLRKHLETMKSDAADPSATPTTPAPIPAPTPMAGSADAGLSAEEDQANYDAQVAYEQNARKREFEKANEKRKAQMLAEDAMSLKSAMDSKAPGSAAYFKFKDQYEAKQDELAALVSDKPAEKKAAAANASTGDALGDTRRAVQSGQFSTGPRLSMTSAAQRFRSHLTESKLPGSVGLSTQTERDLAQYRLQRQTLDEQKRTNEILRKGILGD